MDRLTRTSGPHVGRVRLGLLGGLLVAALTVGLAAPVLADGYNQGRQGGGPGHQWQGQRHGPGPRGRNNWHRGRPWARYQGPRYQGYYQQPNVYYSAPPVVYQPPGASVNFSFPFFR